MRNPIYQRVAAVGLFLLLIGFLIWKLKSPEIVPLTKTPDVDPVSQAAASTPPPTGSERLLEGYADPANPPIEDLRKLHRLAIGYFSVVKNSQRFPIGGNADFAAALRGENPNREIYVRPGHEIFAPDGQIRDRWGSPMIVHPQAWQQLELRSAGPDRIPYNADDLILDAKGSSVKAQ